MRQHRDNTIVTFIHNQGKSRPPATDAAPAAGQPQGLPRIPRKYPPPPMKSRAAGFPAGLTGALYQPVALELPFRPSLVRPRRQPVHVRRAAFHYQLDRPLVAQHAHVF